MERVRQETTKGGCITMLPLSREKTNEKETEAKWETSRRQGGEGTQEQIMMELDGIDKE